MKIILTESIKNKTMETMTQDIWLAAYAGIKGFKIMDLRSVGDRKLFVFKDTDKFQQIKQDYYWNVGIVDPLKYKREIRMLKSLTME